MTVFRLAILGMAILLGTLVMSGAAIAQPAPPAVSQLSVSAPNMDAIRAFPVLRDGQKIEGDFRRPEPGQTQTGRRCFLLNTIRSEVWSITVSQKVPTFGSEPTALELGVSAANECSGKGILHLEFPNLAATKGPVQYFNALSLFATMYDKKQEYRFVAGGGPYLVVIEGQEGTSPVGTKFRDYSILPKNLGYASRTDNIGPTMVQYARIMARRTAAAAAEQRISIAIAATDNSTASTSKSDEPVRAAGSVFRDCPDVCPEMVALPAGSFLMGSSASEEGRSASEGPQHSVTIGQPFAMGKFEITIAEWNACVADAGCTGAQIIGTVRRPAHSMQWNNARQYTAWLSLKTGKRYFVPSEAEWEYAARAGTTTPWNTGDGIITDDGNILGLFGQIVPAGGFPPNAFGLHDMHGNVAEWVLDCHDVGYFGTPTDGGAAVAPNCPNRVVRGGSFVSDPAAVRSAARLPTPPATLSDKIGFRVARAM
jgi:formylglycine-generating enzyme required for sulfatase activity